MYGLIGKMTTHPGQRQRLLDAMLTDLGEMPGCLSYVVAVDPKDENAVWITEVWESKESHAASLALPKVKAAIDVAMPLIAGFDSHFETVPVGGHGLKKV